MTSDEWCRYTRKYRNFLGSSMPPPSGLAAMISRVRLHGIFVTGRKATLFVVRPRDLLEGIQRLVPAHHPVRLSANFVMPRLKVKPDAQELALLPSVITRHPCRFDGLSDLPLDLQSSIRRWGFGIFAVLDGDDFSIHDHILENFTRFEVIRKILSRFHYKDLFLDRVLPYLGVGNFQVEFFPLV